MESLLHYAWKHKLYDISDLRISTGEQLEIIDSGLYNFDAGPDFFNAKIKIENRFWAGNIEIHRLSSDWYKHCHESDSAYNSVILHVVETADCEVRDSSGRLVPQCELRVTQKLVENFHYLFSSDLPIACADRIYEIDSVYLIDWKNALLMERMERKTNVILEWLDKTQNDWNEVLYLSLARSFGFGVNSDSFERLAKTLPLKVIAKHRDSILQLEALFLGQAGLLSNNSFSDPYYLELRKEYIFLREKYKLSPLDAYVFKNLRIRPASFPPVKLVQLVCLLQQSAHLFSCILEIENIKDFSTFFVVNIPEYWHTHYHFGKESGRISKNLSTSSINLLLINSIVPLLFAYGKTNQKEIYIQRAFSLLESIPAEKNYITNQFLSAGIICSSAADSQALIQLRKEYCDKKKCMYCRIGFRLLAK